MAEVIAGASTTIARGGQGDAPVSTPDTDMPSYLRIRRALAERIERGAYAVGAALPSENDLASEFGTTRLTIRNATDGLVDQGRVRRIQGKGTFVTPGLLDPEGTSRGGFRETARILGRKPSVHVLSRRKRRAGEYYAWLFGIRPDDLLYSLRRLNSVDAEPLTIENTLVPLSILPGVEDVDVQVFSLYETYRHLGHMVAQTQEKLDIVELGGRDAGLLGVAAGSAALLLECVSYDARGQAIEYACSYTRGDRGGYAYDY